MEVSERLHASAALLRFWSAGESQSRSGRDDGDKNVFHIEDRSSIGPPVLTEVVLVHNLSTQSKWNAEEKYEALLRE